MTTEQSNPSRQIAAATLLLSASVLALHPDTPQIQGQQEVGAVKQRPEQQKTGRFHERLPLSKALRKREPRAVASPVPVHDWSGVAECESGGDWHINTGNSYFGGLQMDEAFWANYGGTEFAARPDLATKAQQIVVAERGLRVQGVGAWPYCGRYLEAA